MNNHRKIRIVSDIDDTIYKSPYSISIYPKDSTTFPGVVDIYNKLNIDNEDIIFITARPSIFGIFSWYTLRELTKKTNLKAKIIMGYIIYILLYIIAFVFRCGTLKNICNSYMSKTKYDSFVNIINNNKNFDFFWFGDNSQGDLLTGQRLLKEYNNRIKSVYIRNININNDSVSHVKNWLDNVMMSKENKKLLVHNSYLQVVIDLYYKNFINSTDFIKDIVAKYLELLENKSINIYQKQIDEILIYYINNNIIQHF